MTTIHLPETHSQAVARRLREVMAGLMIKQIDLQTRCGWTRGYTQQRYLGRVSLDVNDLEHIQRQTGIQSRYLMYAEGPSFLPPTPDGGPGGDGGQPGQTQLPRMDSNHQPPDYQPHPPTRYHYRPNAA